MVKGTEEKTIVGNLSFIIAICCVVLQPSFSLNALEVGGGVSQLVPHTTKMLHIRTVPSPLFMFSFNLPWTDSMWHNGFASITLHFHDNGNYEILGKSYGISITWNFPSPNQKLHFKMGTGLAILTKKYDFYTNQENVSIGSHINNVTYVFSGYKLSKNLLVGVGVLHYSAGAISMPNLGLNYPLAMVIYKIGQSRKTNSKILRRANISQRFICEFGVGLSANMPPGAPSAPVIIASFNKHFPINEVITFAPSIYTEFNFRAMMFYYLFKWEQSEGSLPLFKRVLLGFRIGPEIILSATMGKVVLSGSAGWYVYNRVPAPASLFNRLFVTYWVTDNVGISVMVKAHLMAAEFTSINLAIKI